MIGRLKKVTVAFRPPHPATSFYCDQGLNSWTALHERGHMISASIPSS